MRRLNRDSRLHHLLLVLLLLLLLLLRQATIKNNPITGLDRPRGFQEVEAPRQSAHKGGKVGSSTDRPRDSSVGIKKGWEAQL